jgi:hypothetical protein
MFRPVLGLHRGIMHIHEDQIGVGYTVALHVCRQCNVVYIIKSCDLFCAWKGVISGTCLGFFLNNVYKVRRCNAVGYENVRESAC